jgi:anti-sigma factor RsiW
MENRILPFVDGRLKVSERGEVEKHLASCAACRLRVNEFRAVTGLLEELPQIEPSTAFDARVRARVAAEPVKQGWWAWIMPSPRVALAASMLVMATVWIASRPGIVNIADTDDPQIQQDLPVLQNYDVISSFEPLTDLPAKVQTDDTNQSM